MTVEPGQVLLQRGLRTGEDDLLGHLDANLRQHFFPVAHVVVIDFVVVVVDVVVTVAAVATSRLFYFDFLLEVEFFHGDVVNALTQQPIIRAQTQPS